MAHQPHNVSAALSPGDCYDRRIRVSTSADVKVAIRAVGSRLRLRRSVDDIRIGTEVWSAWSMWGRDFFVLDSASGRVTLHREKRGAVHGDWDPTTCEMVVDLPSPGPDTGGWRPETITRYVETRDRISSTGSFIDPELHGVGYDRRLVFWEGVRDDPDFPSVPAGVVDGSEVWLVDDCDDSHNADWVTVVLRPDRTVCLFVPEERRPGSYNWPDVTLEGRWDAEHARIVLDHHDADGASVQFDAGGRRVDQDGAEFSGLRNAIAFLFCDIVS